MARHFTDESLGGEYEVVSFRLSWSALSLFCFALVLPAPYLIRLQPWRPREIWLWPLIPPLVIGVLALAGLLCGLLGLRFSENKGSARWGLLLNGAVFGLILLLYVVMRLIMAGR